jgi:hypothetical protein
MAGWTLRWRERHSAFAAHLRALAGLPERPDLLAQQLVALPSNAVRRSVAHAMPRASVHATWRCTMQCARCHPTRTTPYLSARSPLPRHSALSRVARWAATAGGGAARYTAFFWGLVSRFLVRGRGIGAGEPTRGHAVYPCHAACNAHLSCTICCGMPRALVTPHGMRQPVHVRPHTHVPLWFRKLTAHRPSHQR